MPLEKDLRSFIFLPEDRFKVILETISSLENAIVDSNESIFEILLPNAPLTWQTIVRRKIDHRGDRPHEARTATPCNRRRSIDRSVDPATRGHTWIAHDRMTLSEGVDRTWLVGGASTRTPDSRLPVRDAAHVRTRVSDKLADTAPCASGGRSHRGFARIFERKGYVDFHITNRSCA